MRRRDLIAGLLLAAIRDAGVGRSEADQHLA